MRIIKLLFLCLILGSSSFASPTSQELWDGLHFVHLTNYVANNTVVPGASTLITPSCNIAVFRAYHEAQQKLAPNFNSRFAFKIEQHGNNYQIFDIHGKFSERRLTSHWSVGAPVEDSVLEGDEHSANWNDINIGIVEPAKYFQGQLYGGTHEDMMVIGPHQLSADAIVFVPAQMVDEFKRLNPTFGGAIKAYKSSRSAREAIKTYLKKNQFGPWSIARMPDFSHENSSSLESFLLANRMIKELGEPRTEPNLIRTILKSNIEKKKQLLAQFTISNALPETRPETLVRLVKSLAELEQNCQHWYRRFLMVISFYDPVISVDGRLSYGRDFFQAWIKDGFIWQQHNGSKLWDLETKLKKIYKTDIFRQQNLIFEFFEPVNGEATAMSYYDSIPPKYGKLSVVADEVLLFDSQGLQKEDVLVTKEEEDAVTALLTELSNETRRIPHAREYLRIFIEKTKRSFIEENKERLAHFHRFFKR